MKRYPLIYAILIALAVIRVYAALPSDTTWEIRAACMSSLYGGMYSSSTAAGGGLDYSQQNNPQLTLTDIACANATNTHLTTAGTFTSAMKGNGLYLSGGSNLTAGWYMITAVNSATDVTVDRAANSGGLDGTGGTAKVGGATGFKDATFEAAIPGNVYYVQNDGQHTLSAAVSISTGNGSTALPVKVIGYNSTRNDCPTGSSRPLIAASVYALSFGTNYSISNIRASFSTSNGLVTAAESTLTNCHSSNSHTSSNYGFSIGARSSATNCSATGTTNYTKGFTCSTGSLLVGCNAYDCTMGVEPTSQGVTLLSCVIDSCTTGVSGNGTGADYCSILLSTMYSGTTGVNVTTGETGWRVVNSIISTYTTGITSADSYLGCFFEDYNNIYNCTTDRSNVPIGPNSYDLDPGFVDAANGDFRIGKNCKAKGFPGTIPGAAATCIGYLDAGAVQRIEGTTAVTRATGSIR